MMSDIRMSTRDLLLAVAAALALAACTASRQGLRSSPLVGRTVDVAAQDMYGREVRVPQGGGTVRIVDFWATWCDPCRDQLPFLDRLASEYGAQGLAVYGVSFDEDRAALERFLEHTPVSFEILWDKGGTTLADRLELTRLPTTLLVDRQGVVRDVHLGFDRAQEASIESAIRELLSESPVAP